jgi:RNA polymerase sigma factor (sigma-70 family)
MSMIDRAPSTGMADALALDVLSKLSMDEPAFLALYARTAGPLARYLRRLTGNHAAADDLLQDTFLRFLAHTRVPEAEEHQKNYLFRIATNLARDHYRQSQQEPLVHDARLLNLRGPSTSTDDRDVWSLMAQLPPRDRELLLLAYVEGLTHLEIARVTGLMRASVRPLLFRARRRFAAAARTAGLDRPQGGGR